MTAAARPQNEGERLTALADMCILDTGWSAEFDIFPELASKLFAAPMAAISLVDAERQWFKASVGLADSETPRAVSFCAHAILRPEEAFCIPDAALDPRFADNPLVTGALGLRFYAGAPIFGPDGHVLGTLCVLDRAPRLMGDALRAELRQLEQLAVGVGSALKLHVVAEERRHMGMTDTLTGLTNRGGFHHGLRAALARRMLASGYSVGLLLVDLDHFKAINDLFGHAAGDAALCEVARRIAAAMRERDLRGRLEGNAFAVVVEDVCKPIDLNAVAARIHAMLAEPYFIERQAVTLRACIGVAVCPADADDADGLIRMADTALQAAKREGPGITRFGTPGAIAEASAAPGRLQMRDLLRHALLVPGQEPFALALQPIFRGRGGQLVGFEALVRWPDGEGRVRQPAEFIPVAEATGMIMQIDRWVMDKACALAARWPDHLQISTNLSAANFFAGDLVGDVRATLERHGLAPGRLRLEVTESALLLEPPRVRDVITALRATGVQIVLDDFGAGYASLAYLKDYAFDGLKIDRSFAADIETDRRSRAFVRAILDMGRALEIDTTVEGVETAGQMRMLQADGATTVQGYLLGRPMTPDAAATLIINRPDKASASSSCEVTAAVA
jgi:diguanylate cyclase (GGDEF)-like protein